jgi:hypothetical protein
MKRIAIVVMATGLIIVVTIGISALRSTLAQGKGQPQPQAGCLLDVQQRMVT